MLGPLLAALCLAAASPAQPPESGWHDTLSPHFHVFHEDAFMPGGFTLALERFHGRLRFELGMFTPWMSKERVDFYLYHDRDSYARGEFHPPPWSNGVSIYDRRVVAVYNQSDRAKLLQIAAHETTHLIFESYWAEEGGKQPPSWLNEGLAMTEEVAPEHPEQSEWFRAMARLPQRGYLPLDHLFTISPTKDLHDSRRRVETWYVQSYSVVYFLLRKHSRLQFKSFCEQLRDGVPVQEALWRSYRYHTLARFEQDWLRWVTDPSVQRLAAAGDEAAD